MRIDNFSKLFQRHGGYSMPVLVELKYPKKPSWYFTNNRQDVVWNGKKYVSTSMSYKPPGSKDGIPSGGTLEITVNETLKDNNEREQELLKWFDEADDKAEIEINAVINEHGEITQIGQFQGHYGTASWDGKKITWNMGEDDRLQMQINPWIFDFDALVG